MADLNKLKTRFGDPPKSAEAKGNLHQPETPEWVDGRTLRAKGRTSQLATRIDPALHQKAKMLLVGSMCAGAIGEIIGSTSAFPVLKIISAGSILVLLFFSALVFASITSARLSGIPFDFAFVEQTSEWFFVSAFILCGCCILLSET